MKTLFAGHYFLSAYPLYLYAVIFLIGYLSLLLGRKIFEGKAYNVARSADLGDASLTAFIILGALIIREPYFNHADWLDSKTFHYSILTISIGSALIYFLITKPKQVMDAFHAVVILPAFVYFILITIPIYLYTKEVILMYTGSLLLLIWVLLVIWDAKEKRLDQRAWMKIHRPYWYRKLKN